MGADESRIKEPPSLQVQSLLTLFWNMNYKDQKHFTEIIQSEESQLKVLHQYREVDIPLPIWQMFARMEFDWYTNQQMINRWKQLWPHFKGIAISKSKSVAFCISPHLVTEKTDEPMEQIIFKIGESFSKLSHKPLIEYNGYVNDVADFLHKGPLEKPERFSLANFSETFKEWMERECSENEIKDADLNKADQLSMTEWHVCIDRKWAKLMEDLNGKN